MSSHRSPRSYDTPRGRATVLAALALTILAPLTARAQCTVTDLTDSGSAGSLRACIAAANTLNNGQIISFSPSLNGGIITVGSTLEITGSMTITGPAANLLTISGGNAAPIFDIGDSISVNISGLTIANGNSGGSGGGIRNNGTLTVSNCTFSGNTATYGGGIFNGGALTVNNSTFSGNTAMLGGGIFSGGVLMTVNNSTFFGNTASGTGGGIENTNAGVQTINNSTISGNTASSGGGVYCIGGASTTGNSIVAGNTSTAQAGDDYDNCGMPASSLISTPSAIVNPQLSAPGWYGGATQTMLPLPGSPAIGQGIAAAMNPANMDQRGFSRRIMGAIDIGAVQTNYLLVTTTADVSDMTPACDAIGDSPCSLRDALTLAASAGSADIGFVAGLAGIIGLSTVNTPLPAITGNLDLAGPGPHFLTVSGGGSSTVSTVFTLNSGANAAFSNIAIANGNSGQSGFGGGIFNDGGTLTVSNSAFSGGSAGIGGGICNDGTLAVYSSTFSGNTAATYGGGIFNVETLVVANSSFSGNSAINGGGGIYDSSGPLTVNNSTFSGNTSGSNTGGGISNSNGTLAVNNSILTADTGGECNGSPGCPSNGVNGNVVDPTPAQPILAPLGWYGGPTPTMLPLPGSPASPAICAGSLPLAAGLTTDQRGFARTNLMSGCLDAGAVQTNYLIVTTTTDVSDPIPACDAAGDAPCSLRDTLTVANPAGADIAFAANLTGTIDLSTVNAPLPAITGNLDLFGPGATAITVSGGDSINVGTIFTVNPGANAAISGIAIFDADSMVNGGGIDNNAALAVSNTSFSLNATEGDGTAGGGIYNDGVLAVSNSSFYNANIATFGGGIANAGTMIVTNSSFSANGAANTGGGIANLGTLILSNSTFYNDNIATFGGGIANVGTLTVTNSTFSGNSADSSGGGIYNGGGALVVNDSTVSRNNAEEIGGGIAIEDGTLTLANSIVAGNFINRMPVGDDCDNCGTQSSFNLIGGAPQLAALGSYGGPFQTMLPLPGSPAICAGSAALLPAGLLPAGLAPAGLATDERGFPRLNTTYSGYSAATPCLDLGAVQTNYQSVQFTNAGNSGYSGIPGVAVSTPAAPIVSVTENGQNTGAVPVTLSFMGTQPSTSSGLGPVTTVAGTGATFPALKVRPGANYTLEALLAITPSVSISGTAALNIDSAATVTSLTSTSTGTYTTTAQISIAVNFNKAVNVTGTPALVLNSGGRAVYASGTGTSSLLFTYNVASPQSSAALDASSTTALKLNGGSIQDSSNVAANLTLPTPGAAGSLSANTTIVINTTQYKLTTGVLPAGGGTVQANPTSTPNVTPALATGTYLSGSQVQITATPASAAYSFSDWTGTAPTSPSNPLTITMNSSVAETAHFTLNTVGVTINTSPQGLLVSVDNGAPAAAPVNLTWVIGKQHKIATTTPQTSNNTLYNFAGWSDMGALSHVVTATVGTTSYTASFAAPPTITKSFSPNSIPLGGFSTLSFNIANPSATLTQTAVFFRDTFPAGMQVAGTPNATNTCGGTFTAPAGATAVHLNGGSLAPSASCSLSVLVKGTMAGMLNNTTSQIVSTNAGTGATSNTASLTVNAPATITLLQHISKDAGTTPSSSLAFPSSNTAGNFIAVVVRGGVSNEAFTVQDSAGNMYQKAVQLRAAGSPGGESLAIYYAQSIAGGANTVTVSQSVSATLRFAILEYSGIAATNALDRVASAQGTSATPNSGSVTTTTSGDLLLAGILSVDSETYTPGNGYTAEEAIPAQPNTKLLLEQQIQSADGPVSAGATLGSADPWGAVLAAFHPATAVIIK